MVGQLTASVLSAPTVTSTTTIGAKDITATGTVSANALSATTTTTTGGVTMPPTGTEAGNTAELRFKELAANGPHYVGLKAPDSILMNQIWTLPAADATVAAQVLASDHAGTLYWKTDANSGGTVTNVFDSGLGIAERRHQKRVTPISDEAVAGEFPQCSGGGAHGFVECHAPSRCALLRNAASPAVGSVRNSLK